VENGEDEDWRPLRKVSDKVSGACPEAKPFESGVFLSHTAQLRVLGDKQEGILEIIGEFESRFFAAFGKIGSCRFEIGSCVFSEIEWESQLAGLSGGFLRLRCCSDSTHRGFAVDNASGSEVFQTLRQLILHVESPAFLLFKFAEAFADDLGGGIIATGSDGVSDEFFEFGGE
jgi:hypothetical protein